MSKRKRSARSITDIEQLRQRKASEIDAERARAGMPCDPSATDREAQRRVEAELTASELTAWRSHRERMDRFASSVATPVYRAHYCAQQLGIAEMDDPNIEQKITGYLIAHHSYTYHDAQGMTLDRLAEVLAADAQGLGRTHQAEQADRNSAGFDEIDRRYFTARDYHNMTDGGIYADLLRQQRHRDKLPNSDRTGAARGKRTQWRYMVGEVCRQNPQYRAAIRGWIVQHVKQATGAANAGANGSERERTGA